MMTDEIPFSSIDVRVTILHTNDMHSAAHRYSSIYSYMNGVREEASSSTKDHHYRHVVLTLDAGDFFSGSMYDSLATSKPHACPQLEFFSAAGYDAVIFGNHEYDAGEQGLFTMLSKVDRVGSLTVLASDLSISESSPFRAFYNESATSVPEHGVRIQSALVREYDIDESTTFRVGIIGLMGPDAALLCQHSRNTMHYSGFSDTSGLIRWDRLVEDARGAVRRLRDEEKCDLIVMVAHSGGEEVRRLAGSVEDVNVVIAGHTHEIQFFRMQTSSSFYGAFGSHAERHRSNQVIVSQCANDGLAVGRVDLDVSLSTSNRTRVRVSNATREHVESNGSACVSLKEIRRRLEANTSASTKRNEMDARVDEWREELRSSFLGRNPNEIVYEGREGELFRADQTRSDVAQVVADGILDSINRHHNVTSQNVGGRCETFGVDLYITCPDCVRDFDLPEPNETSFRLTFEDVARMLSISASKGVHMFHMRKRDVAAIVELAEWAELFISDTWKVVVSSTMRYKKVAWGFPFVNRLSDMSVRGVSYGDLPDLLCVGLNGYIT